MIDFLFWLEANKTINFDIKEGTKIVFFRQNTKNKRIHFKVKEKIYSTNGKTPFNVKELKTKKIPEKEKDTTVLIFIKTKQYERVDYLFVTGKCEQCDFSNFCNVNKCGFKDNFFFKFKPVSKLKKRRF